MDAENSYLTMGLYTKETTTKMDLVVVDSANGGLKAIPQYIKEERI